MVGLPRHFKSIFLDQAGLLKFFRIQLFHPFDLRIWRLAHELPKATRAHYLHRMCGRITPRTGELPGLVTVEGYGDRCVNDPRDWVRFNGAPSQNFWIIRKHPRTNELQRDRLTWGLIPNWLKGGTGGRKPINAKAETVALLPTFRDAYKYRRCIVPIDNFFEWKGAEKQATPTPSL